tara:strand:- start:81 stop:467 length:387 start_codon:yes stop_codon:yes gene_type:complete
MQDPKLFKISEKDKVHYKKLINKIDISKKGQLIEVLGKKIQKIINKEKMNILEADLIEKMAHLLSILDKFPSLPSDTIKKILFAMSYFIDENDDIPDFIPDLGYLDDISVVNWILEDISEEISLMPRG